MTISLLAGLIFASLIILLGGAMIYFNDHIKIRNLYYRSRGPWGKKVYWPRIFLRGNKNTVEALKAAERLEALLTPKKRGSRANARIVHRRHIEKVK